MGFWFPVAVSGDVEDLSDPSLLLSRPFLLTSLSIFFSEVFTGSRPLSVPLLLPESRSPRVGCKKNLLRLLAST